MHHDCFANHSKSYKIVQKFRNLWQCWKSVSCNLQSILLFLLFFPFLLFLLLFLPSPSLSSYCSSSSSSPSSFWLIDWLTDWFKNDLPWQYRNGFTRILTSGVTAQYLRFAPWRPLSDDGLCLRIDVFHLNSSCKKCCNTNLFFKLFQSAS